MAQEAITQVRQLVERADEGELFVLESHPHDEQTGAQLEQAYTDGIEAEWQEFLSECDKYASELDREVKVQKFTLAELEEEEQSLDRLRRWQRALALRDRFGAPSAAKARLQLDERSAQLDDYAEQVYRALGQ